MHKISRLFIKIMNKFAVLSANSLSMIGMYEPDCPKELK